MSFSMKAAVFTVDTLIYRGDPNKYINFVILGDGFTSTEQGSFKSNAQSVADAFISQSPWSAYKNYINFFGVEVISTASGAKHPNTASDCSSASPLVPVANPNNYLGSTFDFGGIHRLVVPTNNTNIVSTLSSNFPNYDQVIILTNTPYYGGSGGTYATATLNTASNELAFHETGHSFAGLADEYYAGDIYAAEKPNMTKETNTTLVKWKNWIGVNGIGINQHCCGGSSSLWYKPFTDCKMQYLNSAFCSVCKETLVEKIHSLVNPIVRYTPTTLTVNSSSQLLTFKLNELMLPTPNTLKIVWKLNGNVVANNIDSILVNQSLLPNSTNTLVATVTDTTTLLKINNHATLHVSTVSWTINKVTTGVKINANDNKIEYSLFPNPVKEMMTVKVNMVKKSIATIDVFDLNGINYYHLEDNNTKNDFQYNINTVDLASGVYFVKLQVGDMIETKSFIKE